MAKEALKRKTAENQNGQCNLTKVKLPKETKLFDTHRPKAKRHGGDYTKENTTVVVPIAHMKEHGNYREREEEIENIKMIVDDRKQVMKSFNKINNQILALKRGTDRIRESTMSWLISQKEEARKKLREIDKELTEEVKKLESPLAKAALNVKGIGPVTVAYCLVYIDVEEADHATSLWAYAGLHCASHDRYKKGESSGGNKNLRTVLYTMADSQMKTRGAYRYVYDNIKSRLEKSDNKVLSRNTQGKLIECAWKDTKPSHRHGTGLRQIMKYFLADWWYVARSLKGLPVGPLYPESHLGKNHKTSYPQERGWVF